MNDGLTLQAGEDASIADVPFDEAEAGVLDDGGEILPAAVTQVIDADHAMALLEQALRQVGSYETGGTGDDGCGHEWLIGATRAANVCGADVALGSARASGNWFQAVGIHEAITMIPIAIA